MPMREVDQNEPPADIRVGTSAEAKTRRVSAEEERRHAALAFAIQGQSANLNTDYVIKRAVDFENYLKSGSV